MTPVLATRGLAVGWPGCSGQTPVLAGVDLTVPAGERLALVGPNGGGKTTLLRALAGLDPPLAGAIAWNGGPLPRGRSRVALVGVLLQNEASSPFTVRQLVELGLALEGPPPPELAAQVDEVLARFGLGALADRLARTLSGGEHQRVRLARALVARPRLLLLDEPTNHLDPTRQSALLGWLAESRTCWPELAVVIATHDLGLAARSNRVALLQGGSVRRLGRPDQVLTEVELERTFDVPFRRLDDPSGGPPVLQVRAPGEAGADADRPMTSRQGHRGSSESPSAPHNHRRIA